MEFLWVRLIALVTFGGFDIGVAIYARYVQHQMTKTSYAAHIAGALAGFLLGIFALKNLKARYCERVFGWFCLATVIVLVGFAIAFNIINERHFDNTENPRFCYDMNRQASLFMEKGQGNYNNFDKGP